MTHDEFIEKLGIINPNIRILSDYTGGYNPIICSCLTCGHTWSKKNACTLLRKTNGNGCPECARRKRSKTHEQFVVEIKNSIPDIEVLSKYTGDEGLVKCRCLKCGKEWETAAHNLVILAKRKTGNGCTNCRASALRQLFLLSEEDVINELKELRPDIEIISHYTGDKKPLKCKCKNCDHIWDSTRRDLLMGRNCPNCYGHSGTSYVEQIISLAFETVLPDNSIKHRSKELIGKELDIYIPSLHIAIEPGSWYFHKNKVDNDNQKRLLCSAKGVRLIILYDNCNLDKPPFETDCYITGKDLSRVENADYLKLFVMQIMDSVGLDYSLFLETFEDIKIQAKERSKRRGTKRFKDELYKINPNIIVVGEYVRGHEPIKCKCRICGCEWEPIPNALLRGTGCPDCGGTRLKTHDEFISQMKEINPTIEIRGQYVNVKTHVDCRCTVCGCEWSPIPGSLLRGQGCPECGRKKSSVSRTLSQDEVVNRLHTINPNFELVGSYINSTTSIRCRCKVCGGEWDMLLVSLSEKSCCPECANKQRTKDIVRKLQEKNPNIELVSSYVNSSTLLRIRCRTCGFEWKSMPSNVLQRTSCSECKRRNRVNEAIEQLKTVNADIELLSTSINISSPVDCRCRKCGHEWTSTLYRLLKGSGCAECAKKKAGQYHALSHDEMVERLKAINTNVEIIGLFVGTSKHVDCKCNVCGSEWSPVAGSLLAGTGCPECGKIKSHKAKRKPVLCIETNVVYTSLEEAEENTGICSRNIGSCCRGERKRAGKFHWKFIN